MGKPRKPIADLIEELKSWLPNYDHGPNDYPTLLWRILASLPGGDRAEDMGYEPFQLGWQEVEQLGRVLEGIQDTRDVEDLIDGLLEEEGEEVEERRRLSTPHRLAHVGRVESVVRGPYEAMRLPDGQWRLSHHGRVLGVYPSSQAAMTAATDHERGRVRESQYPRRRPTRRR